jgi:antitoxin VapB
VITKVFKSGNSQAVRIPREFRLDTKEVEIFRRGEELVVRKRAKNLAHVFDLLASLPPDFMKRGRKQPKLQVRRGCEVYTRRIYNEVDDHQGI